MQTSENASILSPTLLLIVGGILISLLIWFKFVDSAGEPVGLPGMTGDRGKQLELPFKDPGGEPKADEPAPSPVVKKRFDDNRLGTCIIYALVAPSSGEYLIPGCYGKPDTWQFVEEGTVLKVGRHWNVGVGGCLSVDKLINLVLNVRYASDQKFPFGKISVRIGSKKTVELMDVRILECTEQVTEGVCETIEKKFIAMNGGSKNLLLNCCCR